MAIIDSSKKTVAPKLEEYKSIQNRISKIYDTLPVEFRDPTPSFVIDKIQKLILETSKGAKETERAIKADDFKTHSLIEELCEKNAKRIYHEAILKKLKKTMS